MSNKILRSYLAGIVEGDGCIYTKQIANINNYKFSKIHICYKLADDKLVDYLINNIGGRKEYIYEEGYLV